MEICRADTLGRVLIRLLHPVALLLFAAGVPAWSAELRVAAASDLIRTLPALGEAFQRSNDVRVIASFGPTSQLAQQIENGAPYDVFLSADVRHVTELISKGAALAGSNIVFGRGQLAVWAPAHAQLGSLAGLTAPVIRSLAMANPDLAPFGAAARESLERAGLWKALAGKVVYAPSVAVAKQFADTGNVDAAFIAVSLVSGLKGHYFTVAETLHLPIDEAACVVARTLERRHATAFVQFLGGAEARAILRRYGFTFDGSPR